MCFTGKQEQQCTQDHAKDILDGLIDLALTENSEAMANDNAALFIDQDVDHMRAENARACTDFSAVSPCHLSLIERQTSTPTFSQGWCSMKC